MSNIILNNPYAKYINPDGSINKFILSHVELEDLPCDYEIKPPILTPDSGEFVSRNQEIIRLFNIGYNQSQIGRKLKISRERVRQLLPSNFQQERDRQIEEFRRNILIVKQVISVLRQFAIWGQHNINQYNRGCRCSICRRALADRKNKWYQNHKDHVKAYVKKWTKKNSKKHKKYIEKWKKNALKELLETNKKHGKYGYTVGCRCPICKEGRWHYDKYLRPSKKQNVNVLSQSE